MIDWLKLDNATLTGHARKIVNFKTLYSRAPVHALVTRKGFSVLRKSSRLVTKISKGCLVVTNVPVQLVVGIFQRGNDH